MDDDEKTFYHGHRQRLRTRAIDHPASLSDQDLLELLLFNVQPRRDVKPLTKRLLRKFGGLDQLLQAENMQLAEQLSPGGIALIVAIRELTQRLGRPRIRKDKMFSSWDKVVKYYRATIGSRQLEELRMMMFNGKNYLIFEEVVQVGTINHVIIYRREILKRVLLFNAASIVLVHNHPSGDLEPSREDIKTTLELKEMLEQSGVKLHDHIIITNNGHFSMRSEGLFDF